MSRRLRRLVWVLLPLSLLAVCLLSWARSYLPDHAFVRTDRGSLLLFFVGADSAYRFDPAHNSYSGTGQNLAFVHQVVVQNKSRHWEMIGFAFIGFASVVDTPRVAAIPFWFLALLVGGVSAWTCRAYRRQVRRERGGSCRGCGYDLRASNGTCPECGLRYNPPVARAREAAELTRAGRV